MELYLHFDEILYVYYIYRKSSIVYIGPLHLVRVGINGHTDRANSIPLFMLYQNILMCVANS